MKNILIVEDSKLFSGLINKKISKYFPYSCIVKHNYQDAVTFLQNSSEQILLAVLDMNLPDAPNGEIINYVISKGIPSVVMTSYVNDEVHDKILNLKPFDYILKEPNSLDVLSNTIHRYLRNRDLHILLVDDSNISRQITSDLLVSQFFQIIEANNGADALKELENDSSIKLLITDYHMPQMDGFELTKEVRKKYAMEDLAIIGISARGNPLLASQFLKCGANDFIAKPFFAEELLWRVNQNVELMANIAQRRQYHANLEKEVERQTAEIKKSQTMIIQQEKLAAIGQLSAGVAHEINNPIGFISSNLGSMKKYMKKLCEYIEASKANLPQDELSELREKLKIDFILEDVGELVNESTEGTNRVKEIINNLKSFSRSDEAEAKETDINECIESTLKIVWNELKYKSEVIKEYGDLPSLKCYHQQLNQVFMNLLVNAAQAIEEQGIITIQTWADKKNIYVAISDTGQGIKPENIDHLFEAFFTTKEVGKGTGLGLSIAHGIITKHSGTIDVESHLGTGTKFKIALPVEGVT